MGACHLKSGRSRMRGNNLLYEIFRERGGGGGGGVVRALSFNETGLGVTFGLRSDLPWTWPASFPPAYLS